MDNPKEILPIVDITGVTIGKATRAECHNGSKILHPVVHLHIINSKGKLFLQHRPAWKDIQPGKWDTAVGGHVGYEEDYVSALKRETFEELGLKNFNYLLLHSYQFESEIEREYVMTYITLYDDELFPSEETDGGLFWSIEEISDNIGKGVFTPNFEHEFLLIKHVLTNIKIDELKSASIQHKIS